MEMIQFEKDIPVRCITAESFPDGVLAAHQMLHRQVPFSAERGYYGISWGQGAGIVYRAAAGELFEGELKESGLEVFVIRKGNYRIETIRDYMNDLPAIGKTFAKMLQEPGIHPQGYCLEIYINDKDMQCLTLLEEPFQSV